MRVALLLALFAIAGVAQERGEAGAPPVKSYLVKDFAGSSQVWDRPSRPPGFAVHRHQPVRHSSVRWFDMEEHSGSDECHPVDGYGSGRNHLGGRRQRLRAIGTERAGRHAICIPSRQSAGGTSCLWRYPGYGDVTRRLLPRWRSAPVPVERQSAANVDGTWGL